MFDELGFETEWPEWLKAIASRWANWWNKAEDSQVEAAQKAAHIEAQKAVEDSGSDSQSLAQEKQEVLEPAGVCDDFRESDRNCENASLTPTGFEPVLPA